VYSRQVAGQELDFGVSGKLLRNVLVMYDRQTESLWSQLYGRALDGPLAGVELTALPAWHTSWEDWRSRHPETLALIKGYRGLVDPYTSYYRSSRAGVLGQSQLDERLGVKEFVIGVAAGPHAVAYPFSQLNQQPVINHRVGNIPLLVVFDAVNGSGVVFDRRMNGGELTFRLGDDLLLFDDQTGSLWEGLTGQALEGELAGRELTRVKSTRAFWFGWVDAFPHTEVFGVAP
jgi:hypothetical protein